MRKLMITAMALGALLAPSAAQAEELPVAAQLQASAAAMALDASGSEHWTLQVTLYSPDRCPKANGVWSCPMTARVVQENETYNFRARVTRTCFWITSSTYPHMSAVRGRNTCDGNPPRRPPRGVR